MNEILVALDFSNASVNALEHTIGLAKKFNSSLLLAWVGNKNSLKRLGASNINDAKEAAIKKFNEIKLNHSEIDVEYKLLQGNTHSEITKLAKEMKVDLIVVGITGKSGFSRFFIGDNTSEIIKKSECPVLTISSKRKTSQGLEKIVLPIDDALTTRQKVPITTKFAKAFGAKVYVVGVYTSSVGSLNIRVSNYLKQVAKHLSDLGINYEVDKVKASNISKATIDYAEKIDANLIAIMQNEEGSATEFFLGSQAQQIINQSLFPVIVVKDKEFMQERPGR